MSAQIELQELFVKVKQAELHLFGIDMQRFADKPIDHILYQLPCHFVVINLTKAGVGTGDHSVQISSFDIDNIVQPVQAHVEFGPRESARGSCDILSHVL